MTHTPAQVAARADVGGGVERVEVHVDRGCDFEAARAELDEAASFADALKRREAAQQKDWGVVNDLKSAISRDAFRNSFYLARDKHAKLKREPAWISTAGLGRPDHTLKCSRSAESKSIRLSFGRIDRARRVLEEPKSSRRTLRIRAR